MTYWGRFWLAIDELGAAIVFNKTAITISSLAAIVKAGREEPLKLYGWQRSFLLWLAPRLGKVHCALALAHDKARLLTMLTLLSAVETPPIDLLSTPTGLD